MEEESLYVKWNYDQTMIAEVGNKGARLGEIRKIGVKIPEGFAITQKAFLDFIADNRIYDKIKKLLVDIPSDVHAIKDRSQRLCDLFIDTEIQDKITNELIDACNRLILLFKKKIHFAVRSSSIIEDLKQASFAGLYDTFLQIESCNEVLKSVKKCWQSTFNFRALTYLKKLGLRIEDTKDIAISVLVQQMIDPKFSGVLFTVNPVNGDPSKVLIEHSENPREFVVSGNTTPSSILIDKITNQIEKKRGRLLEQRYIHRLVKLAKSIEGHFDSYQDIEWVIDRDSQEVVILQARPETIWNERHKKPFHKHGQGILNFVPEIVVYGKNSSIYL